MVSNRSDIRSDPSRSRETGGSGLRLAIVKAIVEAHGGAVSYGDFAQPYTMR